jgi:hypothetical protein
MKHCKPLKWLLAILVQLFFFTSYAQLNKGEYFFDTDPGAGNGFALSSAGITTMGADSATFSGAITVPSALSPGRHMLFVRFKNADSSWSLYQQKAFLVTANGVSITQAEYFFDTDPGAGLGQPIAVTGNTDSSEFAGTVSTAGLSPGYHYLNIRTKTASGIWGHYESKRIRILASGNLIVRAEYFYDTDPGVGNGTSLATTAAGTDSATITAGISTAGLNSGYHNLFVRALGADGVWSTYDKQRVFINAVVTKAEYFVDTDPGVGNGTALTLSAAGDYTGPVTTVSCLAVGSHNLYVRAMNSDGVWGLYDSASFAVNPAPVSASVRYPGPGPNGTPLRLIGAGGCTAVYKYKNITLAGAETATPTFLVPNGSTSVFAISDSAGNSDTLTFVAPTDPTDITTASVVGNGGQAVTLDGWNQWVYVQDPAQKIIAAINDHGYDLGVVTVEDSVVASGVRHSSVFGSYYLDRNWKISSSKTPAGAVGLRLYIAGSEYDSLAAVDAGIRNPSMLRIRKYNGINENLTLNDNAAGAYSIYTQTPTTYTGTSTTGYVLECSVPGFSEFYVSSAGAVVLPLDMISFTAQRTGTSAQLNWTTANSVNVRGFEVQRSTDGNNYTVQGFVNAGAANHFEFSQPLAGAGNYFYRLRIVDLDGRFKYSPVRILIMNSRQPVQVYPNPVLSAVHIATAFESFNYRLMDAQSRVIMTGRSLNSGVDLNMTGMASGMYFIEIETAGDKTVEKIIKK